MHKKLFLILGGLILAGALGYSLFLSDDTSKLKGSLAPLPPTAVAAPTNLTVQYFYWMTYNTNVIIDWTDNATNEDFYKVVIDGVVVQTLPANRVGTEYLLGGEHTYSIYVYAGYYGEGDVEVASDPSETVLVRIARAPAGPSNFALATTTASSVGLSWNDNSNDETYFKILTRIVSTNTILKTDTAPANNSSFTVTGLTPGTAYRFHLYACKDHLPENITTETDDCSVPSVPGPYSLEATTISLPAAPAGLKVTSKTKNSISLSWTDKSSNEDHFQVGVYETTGGFIKNFSIKKNLTSATVSSLTANAMYLFDIAACNNYDECNVMTGSKVSAQTPAK